MSHVYRQLLLCSSLLLACCHPERNDNIIARVGDATLTLEEARSSLDADLGSSERQLREFVTHWVNTQLIYQEARRQGIQNSAELKRRLLDAERQITTQTFLEQQLYSDTSGIAQSQVREYYDNHASEFIISEDFIKLRLIAFNSRERASRFSTAVSRGTTWKQAQTEIYRDSSALSAVTVTPSEEYYTKQSLSPPELWKVATSLNPNEVSFPVKSSVGFFVIQVLYFVTKGSAGEFELVRGEVYQRMFLENRRRRYEDLLGNLRKRYHVEVMVNANTITDTTRLHAQE